MSFFSNMFKTAAQVSVLEQQLAFSEKEREKLEWKVGQLEKQVESERKRFDKTQAATMDFAMQKSGVVPKVEKAQASLFGKEDPPEQKFTPTEESTIEALARAQMQGDRESGFEPYPFEKYVEAIKKDPSKYNAILSN